MECQNAGTLERRNTKTRTTKLLKPGTHENDSTYIHTYKLYSRPKKAFQRIQKERNKILSDNIIKSKIK